MLLSWRPERAKSLVSEKDNGKPQHRRGYLQHPRQVIIRVYEGPDEKGEQDEEEGYVESLIFQDAKTQNYKWI